MAALSTSLSRVKYVWDLASIDSSSFRISGRSGVACNIVKTNMGMKCW